MLLIGKLKGQNKFSLYTNQEGEAKSLATFHSRKDALEAERLFAQLGEKILQLESKVLKPGSFYRHLGDGMEEEE